MARTLYEQFPYQQSLFEEISRPYAIFGVPRPVKTKVLSPEAWQAILGCSLVEYIAAGDVLSASAFNNAGFFDPKWLDQPNFRPVLEEVRQSVLKHVLENHFGCTREWFKRKCHAHTSSDPRWRRYDFNPLKARPYVAMADGRYLAPVLMLVPQKLSPEALFYEGIAQFGSDFADDVGIILEHYVGDQLRLVGATVLGEITYDRGQKRSVDWFVVFDNLVLLIEVKATRLTLDARMGRSQLDSDLRRTLGRAFTQVNRTDGLLRSGHPDFADIPDDRPRAGLVVTLEPYWMANSPFIRELLPSTTVPTLVCSIRELEQYVALAHQNDGGQLILDILADSEKRTWGLGLSLPNVRKVANPILDEAWAKSPWRN